MRRLSTLVACLLLLALGAPTVHAQTGFGLSGSALFPSDGDGTGAAVAGDVRLFPVDYPVGIYGTIGLLSAPGAGINGADLEQKYGTIGLIIPLRTFGGTRYGETLTTVYGLGGVQAFFEMGTVGGELGGGVALPLVGRLGLHVEAGAALTPVERAGTSEGRTFPFVRTLVTVRF